MKHLFAASLFFLVFCTGAFAASSGKSLPPVIIITLDTTRADHMGFMGSDKQITPQIDAVAQQSVIFASTYAHVPLTTPSHATIFTGSYPQYVQIHDMAEPLSTTLPYLPDILHRQGYATAAFI